MTKTIAIDVDGVCAALHVPWLNRYNKEFNDNLKVSDIVHWNMHDFVKPECGKQIYKYIEDPTIYDETPPVLGSVECMTELKSERKDLRFIYVTNSTLGAAGRKYYWLKQYGFLDSQDDYVEAKDKSLIKADALLDDYQENLKMFIGVKLLFNSTWNKEFGHYDMCRVNNWIDAKDMINKFFPKKEY